MEAQGMNNVDKLQDFLVNACNDENFCLKNGDF